MEIDDSLINCPLQELFDFFDAYNFGIEFFNEHACRFWPEKALLHPENFMQRYLGFYPKIFINISTHEDNIVLYVTHSNTRSLTQLNIQCLFTESSSILEIRGSVEKACQKLYAYVVARQENETSCAVSISFRQIGLKGGSFLPVENYRNVLEQFIVFEYVLIEAFLYADQSHDDICLDMEFTRLLNHQLYVILLTCRELRDRTTKLENIQSYSLQANRAVFELLQTYPNFILATQSCPGMF